MLTSPTRQELATRFGLTPSEIRCLEDGRNQPVSVRVLQARARACVKLAEGRTLLQRFVYKLAEAEILVECPGGCSWLIRRLSGADRGQGLLQIITPH